MVSHRAPATVSFARSLPPRPPWDCVENVWSGLPDLSRQLDDTFECRPLAIMLLADKLPLLERLEYGGARAFTNDSAIPQATMNTVYQKWLQKDVCAVVHALPCLRILSLVGFTALTPPTRRAIRSVVREVNTSSQTKSASSTLFLDE
jgi:hypothetical protein